MKLIPTDIPDVVIIEPAVFGDDRGWFMETFNAPKFNQALADLTHLSPATCHRRLKRLRDEGVIEKQVAILSPHRVAEALGWGVSALVEVSLDMQTQEALDAFEALVVADAQVQQCWRVSPGPDFVLVVQVPDMPAYQALAQRLFTAHHQVRNVRAFFAVKRAKFGSQIPLPPA